MKKILISRTDGIGDLLLTTPLIKAIKESEGRPYVAVMAGAYAASLLENSPDVDEIIIYDREKRRELLKSIINSRFDACISVFPQFDTASLLAFARIPRRIGTAYRWFSTLFFNEPVAMHRKHSVRHEADYNLGLAQGIIGEKTAERLYYYPTDEEKAKARQYLTKKGLTPQFIVIHPGSRGSAWNISEEKYIETADKAAEFTKVLLTGGPQEKEKISLMREKMKNMERAVLLEENMTIREFAAVIGEAEVLVSGSTGPMHLAAAQSVKTLSFFPPDDIKAMRAVRWGPLGNIHEIIMPAASGLPPAGAMETIPVDFIIDKIKNLLAR
jgi:ADP-heptose:LPS heptosyltransferase